MRDPYLYEDIAVLKNKGNIRDAETLRAAEGDVTRLTMMLVYEQDFERFHTDTLREIHRIIFEPLYDFAGEFRSIPIIKREEVLGGDSVRYTRPEHIEAELDAVAKEIALLPKLRDTKELLFRVTRITAKLWQIHPFREGNTRAVIAFSLLLLRHLKVEIDYDLFREHAAYVRNSLVWASQGMYAKFEYLEQIFFDAAGILGDALDPAETKAADYSAVNGYAVANYREQPHSYDEEAE